MFDPGELAVKEAVKQLSGLSDDALSEVYDAELDGKGRKSLLDEITAKRDALREDAAPKAEAPKVEVIHRPARPGAAAASYIRRIK